MQHLFSRVLGCLFAFVLLALVSTSSTFAESNNDFINNNFQRVGVSNVHTMRTTSALSIWPSMRASQIDDLPTLLRPNSPKAETKQPLASQAPQKIAAQPTAVVAEPVSAESNMIAFWHIREGTEAKSNNNTWRVEVEVRVPTSYQYKFDGEYVVSVKRDKMNFEGDDIYTLRLAGIPCRTTTLATLIASHNDLMMQVRNEFTYFEGPIFLNHNC